LKYKHPIEGSEHKNNIFSSALSQDHSMPASKIYYIFEYSDDLMAQRWMDALMAVDGCFGSLDGAPAGGIRAIRAWHTAVLNLVLNLVPRSAQFGYDTKFSSTKFSTAL
jgi:hypothetical protein